MYFTAIKKRDGRVTEFGTPNYPQRLFNAGKVSGKTALNARSVASI